MVKYLQQVLIGVYALARSSGFLDSALGKLIFIGAYWTYKKLLEPKPTALSRYVMPGAWVVDVGANLGFYSQLFAQWVSKGGKVLAFEPEQHNFDNLKKVASRAGDGKLIEPLKALLTETDGDLFLRINPVSHADHRVAMDGEGIQVPSMRLDTALAQRGNPAIGLIKIDVQGAEMRVLQGAVETLRKHRPAIYIEVDDKALEEAGTSAQALEAFLEGMEYAAWQVDAGRLHGPLVEADREAMRKKLGYADFLYLPK